MNPFARHHMEYLSPSRLSLFAAEPAVFVLQYLLKRTVPVGAAAHRGTAAEAGVTRGLVEGLATEACQGIALLEFDRLTALSGDPNRQKERDAVPGCVEQALEQLRPYGVPDQVQTRIETNLDDIPVPIIGFLDYAWSQHGILVDLKTQLRLTSEISVGHGRQVSIYMRATNYAGRLCYATPKKSAVYEVENAAVHITALTQIAYRLQRFLAISDDPQELASIVCPDYEDFRWNNPVARQLGAEVYGF